ncbi:hypothetical protein FLLO111716_13880 [Flavobacterium longum]
MSVRFYCDDVGLRIRNIRIGTIRAKRIWVNGSAVRCDRIDQISGLVEIGRNRHYHGVNDRIAHRHVRNSITQVTSTGCTVVARPGYRRWIDSRRHQVLNGHVGCRSRPVIGKNDGVRLCTTGGVIQVVVGLKNNNVGTGRSRRDIRIKCGVVGGVGLAYRCGNRSEAVQRARVAHGDKNRNGVGNGFPRIERRDQIVQRNIRATGTVVANPRKLGNSNRNRIGDGHIVYIARAVVGHRHGIYRRITYNKCRLVVGVCDHYVTLRAAFNEAKNNK